MARFFDQEPQFIFNKYSTQLFARSLSSARTQFALKPVTIVLNISPTHFEHWYCCYFCCCGSIQSHGSAYILLLYFVFAFACVCFYTLTNCCRRLSSNCWAHYSHLALAHACNCTASACVYVILSVSVNAVWWTAVRQSGGNWIAHVRMRWHA